MSLIFWMKIISILAITESWLVSSIGSSYVDIQGFKFYWGDGDFNIRKHGSGLYVRDDIVAV